MSDTKKKLDDIILTLVRDGGTSSRDRLRVKVTEQSRSVFTTGDIDNALQRLRKRGLIAYVVDQKKWVTTDTLPCERCGGTGVVRAPAVLSSSPVAEAQEEEAQEEEAQEEETKEESEEKETEEPGFKGSRQIF